MIQYWFKKVIFKICNNMDKYDSEKIIQITLKW